MRGHKTYTFVAQKKSKKKKKRKKENQRIYMPSDGSNTQIMIKHYSVTIGTYNV